MRSCNNITNSFIFILISILIKNKKKNKKQIRMINIAISFFL